MRLEFIIDFILNWGVKDGKFVFVFRKFIFLSVIAFDNSLYEILSKLLHLNFPLFPTFKFLICGNKFVLISWLFLTLQNDQLEFDLIPSNCCRTTEPCHYKIMALIRMSQLWNDSCPEIGWSRSTKHWSVSQAWCLSRVLRRHCCARSRPGRHFWLRSR